MGLTIRGQCIPDVAEPMGGRRAAGFWKRGARGACGGGGAEPRAELEPAHRAPQEAEVRPSRRQAAGHQAPEARSGLWGT